MLLILKEQFNVQFNAYEMALLSYFLKGIVDRCLYNELYLFISPTQRSERLVQIQAILLVSLVSPDFMMGKVVNQ